MHKMYSLFHVFLAAPFLIYVGIRGSNSPAWMYGLLAILVVGIVGYHGFRAFQKLADGRSAWINWIHLLLVAPVLAWIAVQQKATPRRAYEMLLMLGFAAIGYHAYHMLG